jgi:hypothetical protein
VWRSRLGFFSFSDDSRFAGSQKKKNHLKKKNAATFILPNALNLSSWSWSSSWCLFSVLSRESERKSSSINSNNGENAEEKKAHARGERREHKRCEEKCQIVLNKRPENVRGETRETLALGEEFNRGREENHGTEYRLEAERLEIE